MKLLVESILVLVGTSLLGSSVWAGPRDTGGAQAPPLPSHVQFSYRCEMSYYDSQNVFSIPFVYDQTSGDRTGFLWIETTPEMWIAKKAGTKPLFPSGHRLSFNPMGYAGLTMVTSANTSTYTSDSIGFDFQDFQPRRDRLVMSLENYVGRGENRVRSSLLVICERR